MGASLNRGFGDSKRMLYCFFYQGKEVAQQTGNEIKMCQLTQAAEH